MNSSAQVFNEVRFDRMSCGDPTGFHELAEEYFQDVRTRLSQWDAMREAGEYRRLSEEFHRCKGGAAMFGFERLFHLLGSWETDSKIEKGDVNLERFAGELGEAEKAISALRERTNA